MECPLTIFRSQSTLEGVNKSINITPVLFIANEQPREYARLRGGSLIKPCAEVPRQNESRVDVTKRYLKMGNKKRATWFATLLQNESNSDVKRFNYHPCSNLLTTWFVVRQVWCGWYNAQHRYSTCFETMFFSVLQNKLHVFCFPFFRTFSRIGLLTACTSSNLLCQQVWSYVFYRAI